MFESKSSQEYLDIMKNIQENILQFLEDGTDSTDSFQVLENIFKDTKIKENKHDFLSFLHLISKILNNYHRSHLFFSKIERILQYFQKDIKTNLTNSEIFNIFKSNKRIILFLIEEQILTFDEHIAKIITTTEKYVKANYPHYFQPEIQPFVNKKWFPKYDPKEIDLKTNIWVEEIQKELPENFYEKRKKGENDNKLCELIRNDMIKEFAIYVTQHNISSGAIIQPSIYETNPFLIKKQTEQNRNNLSLIEYAAFFGSIQIYNHLRFRNDDADKSSLLLFAIHGYNAELIHLIEGDSNESKDAAFYESIKCHHNDFANYFLNNFLQEKEISSENTINQSLKYYNFAFLSNKFINVNSFYNCCKFDHYKLADYILENKNVNINKIVIFKYLVIYNFLYLCFNSIQNQIFQWNSKT
ncbi:hypothetical protein M9Y10_018700 [Tritrichomonas musculus]|uniref:DUF3447 domain-containing protein n=1 Tax=Tritrichomonas musculus TaxID=1915356 RepID=A0ABR2HN78_9EUKA